MSVPVRACPCFRVHSAVDVCRCEESTRQIERDRTRGELGVGVGCRGRVARRLETRAEHSRHFHFWVEDIAIPVKIYAGRPFPVRS
eukprot:304643-Prymnesium_polylepis.3